jgi:hypothetical protein
MSASAAASPQHRRRQVLDPLSNAVVPIATAVVEGPPNNAVVDTAVGVVAAVTSAVADVAATAVPVVTSAVADVADVADVAAVGAVVSSVVDAVPTAVADTAADVSDAAAGVASVASDVIGAATTAAAIASDIASSVVSDVASYATSVITSANFPHPYPSVTASSAVPSSWGINATITTASPTASYASATPSQSMVYTGGLSDPTLDKPCFNSTCSDPTSDMNYEVTISLGSGDSSGTEVDTTTSGAAAKIASWGAIVGGAVAVALAMGL